MRGDFIFYQWPSMNLAQPTFATRKAALRATLLKWSNRGLRTFTMSSASLQKKYGVDYRLMLRQMEVEEGLHIVTPHRVGFYENGRTIVQGRCATYGFGASVTPVSVRASAPLPDASMSAAKREVLDAYLRSDLPESGVTFYFSEGKAGDGRDYSPFTALSKADQATLTIDGQAMGSVDIPNCFPMFMISLAQIPARHELTPATQFLRHIVNEGTLYETLMTMAQTDDRALVKKAVNTMLNHPGALRFQSYDEFAGRWMPRNADQLTQWKVVQMFKILWKPFYDWFRLQARSRNAYSIASQMEREVSNAVKKMMKRANPTCVVLRKHDEFLVPVPFLPLLRHMVSRVLATQVKQTLGLHIDTPCALSPFLFVSPSAQAKIDAVLAVQVKAVVYNSFTPTPEFQQTLRDLLRRRR
jgi:hypothetical protein